jgi:hypothetical protein
MEVNTIIKVILVILIVFYTLKVSSLGFYMYYEKTLASNIEKEKFDVVNVFKELIDINIMKKAFDENDNFDIKFIDIVPNGVKETFTHTLVITVGQANELNYDKIKKYNKSEDDKDLNEIINLYIDNSGEVASKLLNVSEDVVNGIQANLQKLEGKFYILLNFLKTQKYPITIIVDTLLLVAIILGAIVYILVNKLYILIVISLIIFSIVLVVFYSNNTLLILFALIGFYGVYFFELYKVTMKN